MEWWDYLILGLMFIVMAGGFIFVFIKLKAPKNEGLTKEDYAALGKIETQVTSLEGKLSSQVKQSMLEAQLQLSKEQGALQQKMSDQLTLNFSDITSRVSTHLNEGFKSTNDTVAKVNEQLGVIYKTQQNLENIHTDVDALRRILEGNQSRGQLGEVTLETIIRSVFGDDVKDVYDFQYQIDGPKGEKVKPDAVIHMPPPNLLLCIDSKFPYSKYADLMKERSKENEEKLVKGFREDVKGRIKEVKEKYIIEGQTAKQALIFVPSDGIFAFIHSRLPEVVEEAFRQSVILVSPSTLQPILTTIKMIRIDHKRSENVQVISESLKSVGVEFSKFNEQWTTVSKNITTLSNSSEQLDVRFRALQKKFLQIQDSNLTKDEQNTPPFIANKN